MRTTDTAQTTEASSGSIVISRVRCEPIPDEYAAVVLTECPHCGHDLTESATAARVAARPAPALLGEITADVTRDPAVGPRARRVLVTLLEAFDGRRPYSQMVALATPQVIRYLRVAAELYRRESPSRVLSCHVSQPHEGAAEVAALCRIGRRARALAARFELAEAGDWRCIALRVL